MSREDKERRRYEEDNFVRMVVGKVRGRGRPLRRGSADVIRLWRSASLTALVPCRRSARRPGEHWQRWPTLAALGVRFAQPLRFRGRPLRSTASPFVCRLSRPHARRSGPALDEKDNAGPHGRGQSGEGAQGQAAAEQARQALQRARRGGHLNVFVF